MSTSSRPLVTPHARSTAAPFWPHRFCGELSSSGRGSRQARALVVVAVVLGGQHAGRGLVRRAVAPVRAVERHRRRERPARRRAAPERASHAGSEQAPAATAHAAAAPSSASVVRIEHPPVSLRVPTARTVSERVRPPATARSTASASAAARSTPRVTRERLHALEPLAEAAHPTGERGLGVDVVALCRPRRSRRARRRSRFVVARGRVRARSGSSADRVRLAQQLLHREQRRQPGRDAGDERVGAGLVALDLLPVGDDFVGAGDAHVAEHVRMAAHELVVDAAGDVGDRERRRPPPRAPTGSRPGTAGRRARPRARRSARGRRRRSARRSAAPRSPRRPRTPPRARDGASEWCVCFGVPRAPARTAQPFGERDEPRELGRDRELAGVDEHRREVVGLDLAVEIRERDVDDVLVGEPEPLQHGDLDGRAARPRAARASRRRARTACRPGRSASVRPCPAASTPNARASTTRTPPSGSMPRRAHARSANDTPGTISTSTFAARNSSTVFSATFGLPGHRVHDLAVRVRGVDDVRRDRAVHRVEVVACVVQPVERLERDAVGRELLDRRDDARCARTAPATRSNAASAAGRTRSAPAGPSPTTTTRAALTRRAIPRHGWSCVVGRLPLFARRRALRAATTVPLLSSRRRLPRAVARVDRHVGIARARR